MGDRQPQQGDYPHISRDQERQHGRNWIASWSDFWGHREYWRFYQSSQFLHLFTVIEATEGGFSGEWHGRAERTAGRLSAEQVEIAGAFDTVNFVYTVSEVVEFAGRLCDSGLYRGGMLCTIGLRNVGNFMLMAPQNRAPLFGVYRLCSPELENSWTFDVNELRADRTVAAVDIVTWFFERFGWSTMPLEVIRQDVKSFLSGQR